MNRERALDILEIPIENRIPPISDEIIKKQYRVKALQYHPDKNNAPDAVAHFQEIKSAYDYLLQSSGIEDNSPDEHTYSHILKMFLKGIWKGEHNHVLFSIIIEKIGNCCEAKVIELLEKVDNDILIKIHGVFAKYRSAFHFSEEFLKYVEQVLLIKLKKDECIILNPSIDDLFECNLYKITENGNTYIVPLWHHELVYDNSGSNLYVRCNPILPDTISIDSENDLHVFVKYTIADIIDNETVDIDVGTHRFSIYVKQLYLKREQVVVLKNRGIPTINPDNIYSVTKRSNIHIHITLQTDG
jgi:hypothetical protein